MEQTPEQQKLKELQDKRDAIQKRRQERADRERLAKLEQEVADLEAIDQLEEEHGDGRVGTAPLRGWVPDKGAVTRIAIVVPLRSDHSYQRFQELVLKNRKNPGKLTQAMEQLARMVLQYPHPERDKAAYDATLELAPVMLTTIADMAQKLADADAEADEKKSGTS
jgi:hypothetical protein